MKGFHEIPECVEICNEMFAEWDKMPVREGVKDLAAQRKRKEIEKAYWPKMQTAYNKYVQEHPEEFKDEQ